MAETLHLNFIRACKSRAAVRGSDDDCDVYDGEQVVGRITLLSQAPEGRPWFWSITAPGRKASFVDRGYAASRAEAMADFASMWSREVLACTRVVDLAAPSVASFIARCVYCNAQIWVALDSSRNVRRMCLQCAED